MTLTEFFENLQGGARWDVGVSINRSNSLPLDANSVFASYADAENYAKGTPAEGTLANAYPGQILAVVTAEATTVYYIDANMTLQPIKDADALDRIAALEKELDELVIPEVPVYTIRKEENPAEEFEAVYHLVKDGTDVDVAIEIPKVIIPQQTDYTVTVSKENIEEGNLAHYVFTQCGNEIAHIDIPKDLVVESGSVKEVLVNDFPYEGALVGDKYIELKITNQEEALYIPAKDLVEYITVDDTASVDLTLDSNHKLTADVKISAKEGNAISVVETDGEQGLYVAPVVLPTSADYGVLTLTGKDAIAVTEGQNPEVTLVLDNSGNIVLSQSEAGLKAEITLPEIPAIEIAERIDPTKAARENSEFVVQKLEAEDHTITETAIEVVTAGILTAQGLVDPAKIHAAKLKWIESEDGIIPTDAEQTTLDRVLVEATVSTVEDENGVHLTGGTAGLLTPEEKFKLQQLVIDADGSVGISGTISADNVTGLADRIVGIVTGTVTEGTPNLGVEKGAQVNVLEAVKINGIALEITDKAVDIPLATAEIYGVVKSAADIDGKTATNKVYVGADGVGEVKAISTDSIVNGAEELVLFGGHSGAQA